MTRSVYNSISFWYNKGNVFVQEKNKWIKKVIVNSQLKNLEI